MIQRSVTAGVNSVCQVRGNVSAVCKPRLASAEHAFIIRREPVLPSTANITNFTLHNLSANQTSSTGVSSNCVASIAATDKLSDPTHRPIEKSSSVIPSNTTMSHASVGNFVIRAQPRPVTWLQTSSTLSGLGSGYLGQGQVHQELGSGHIVNGLPGIRSGHIVNGSPGNRVRSSNKRVTRNRVRSSNKQVTRNRVRSSNKRVTRNRVRSS